MPLGKGGMLSSWRSLYEAGFELHLELWVGMRYGVRMEGVGGVKGASKQRDFWRKAMPWESVTDLGGMTNPAHWATWFILWMGK